MVKGSLFKTPLFLFLLLLIIIITEARVPMKTFHYVDELKSWYDAQQYCKEKFNDLASASDHKELLHEFQKNRGVEAWIGLYRDPGDPSVWRWTGERGDASSDTNWAIGEPEMRNCTRLNTPSKTWSNRKCSETPRFWCSNEDSIKYDHSYVPWLDALQSCKDKSMSLATVTQSNHRTFRSHGWIGLHIPPNTPGSDISEDIWQWSGEDSDYRNWAPGQPNHDDCGYVSIKTKRWHSSQCSNELLFVCFADNVILVKENKTWEEALEHCRAIGSVGSSQNNHYRDHRYDLVSLQSEDDHRYARDKIQEATTNEVWTALRFLAGQWLWVDGEPQQYQNLPLCPAWGQHCGTLPKDDSAQWQIRDCMERRNFLCIKTP